MLDQHRTTVQTAYKFLLADLNLCATFIDLAHAELRMGAFERAATLRSKAEDGYEMVKGLAAKLDSERQEEIRTKLDLLRERITSIPKI
jgi:hypothetical protein